jgi:hypothetical protein
VHYLFLIILGAIALVCGISEKSPTEDVQKWFSSIGITVEIILN